MRALPLALAAACLVAGCLEPALAPSPQASTSEPRQAVAWHRWNLCSNGNCSEATLATDFLFVAFADGEAWRARLGPGDAKANATEESLALLALGALAVPGGQAVAEVERTNLSEDALATLQHALANFTLSPAPECDGCRVVEALGRLTSDGWEGFVVNASDPRFQTVLATFRAAESAFPPVPVEERPPVEPAPPDAAWRGQDSEMGSIRTPYETRVATDGRAALEARVVLRTHYEEKDARFFLFGWTGHSPPLEVAFERLMRADTGEDLPCYKRETGAEGVRCFVDLRDLPPPGTEIVLQGSAAASRPGEFEAGATVVPFTYTWTRVQTSNGLDAELYATTRVVA